jgi:hypothetical protein
VGGNGSIPPGPEPSLVPRSWPKGKRSLDASADGVDPLPVVATRTASPSRPESLQMTVEPSQYPVQPPFP